METPRDAWPGEREPSERRPSEAELDAAGPNAAPRATGRRAGGSRRLLYHEGAALAHGPASARAEEANAEQLTEIDAWLREHPPEG